MDQSWSEGHPKEPLASFPHAARLRRPALFFQNPSHHGTHEILEFLDKLTSTVEKMIKG